MTGPGHNSSVSGERLRAIVERLERLRLDKTALTDDEAAVFAEAKADGFDTKVLKRVLKRREAAPHDLDESDALLDLYLHALGMRGLSDEPPLLRAMRAAEVDTGSRESIIHELKRFTPTQGEIVLRMGGKSVRLWRDKDGAPQAQEVIETLSPTPERAGPAAARAPALPPEIETLDEAEAHALGREWARENKPVISNPFAFGDPRRARFDEGWRAEAGTDGMGPKP